MKSIDRRGVVGLCPAITRDVWWRRLLRWLSRWLPIPATYGSGKPSHTTDAMWWLWGELQRLEPSTKLGGTFASKPGYHNYRNALPRNDYSVCDQPPDGGGPGDMCGAIDWTFPDAQAGNYTTIARYTKRLLASAQDLHDERLDGWREFYGQANTDTYVEGWDCRYGVPATSDPSHLWHIHLSENRDQSTSVDNKEALLSVLKGETVEQWRNRGRVRQTGDGAVLLNCPFDINRQDLLYVGPGGEVWHSWWAGGMSAMWSGEGASENLGGRIVQGTLTAQWTPDGGALYVAGLGSATSGAPAGTGSWWGQSIDRYGNRSGWGSFDGVWGQYPTGTVSTRTSDSTRAALLIVLVVILAIIGLAAWWVAHD